MVIEKRLGVLLALSAITCGVSVAQDQPDVRPPVNAAQPQVQTGDNLTGSAVGNMPVAVDSNTYEIGPRDIIRVSVWRQPDFTENHAVRPDGRITIPLIKDIQAAGLTPARLGAQIQQALSEWIENPEVTVSVLQVNSKQYTIAGLVLRPGAYPMPTPIRVFEALNYTGGFQQWADKKNIIIIRETGERFKFNYEDFVKGKNTDKNIYLQNGDTVLVQD